MIKIEELILIKGCLEALIRKCKTDGLYIPAKKALDIVVRELRKDDLA